MNTSDDETDGIRRTRLAEINSTVESHEVEMERKRLQEQHGQVWDAAQLSNEFEVLGFLAPYVVVRRRTDGRKGSLEFQHHPSLYFNLVLD